jgi:perosamine synthetase
MIPRSDLDIGWTDLLAATGYCAVPQRASRLHADLEAAWSAPGEAEAVVCLSVRSAFDMLLHVLALPRGSEIIFSAVTIPDMPRIARAHGLVPIPMDLDMHTLAVHPAALERALSTRTKMVVVAHLFGSRMPIEPLATLARRHQLLLVEDCAQAYRGDGYRGSPRSDVALFSFGPIKTSTALGGALVWVRDAQLAARMRDRQAALPEQGRLPYLRRVLKYAAIKLLLLPPAFTLFARLCGALGTTHDSVISGAARGFPGADLLAQIRRRPNTPLLLLLKRRLGQACRSRIALRVANAQQLSALLPQVHRPGEASTTHTHWIFPVLHPQPAEAVARFWRAGFDATLGASSLQVVQPPRHRPELRARNAAAIMNRVLYLPVHPAVIRSAAARLAHVAAGIWPAQTRSDWPGPRAVATPATAPTSSGRTPAAVHAPIPSAGRSAVPATGTRPAGTARGART